MQLPFKIGNYELLELLSGGMSQIYRARDTRADRPVVVKILTAESAAVPEAKARFLHEARVGKNIQHENIVSVLDYGEYEGRPFLVMEYLEGEDLRAALRDGTVHDGAHGGLIRCLQIAEQTAAALQYVHGLGVVHRDVKPENIHLDPSGKARLMDFGIAKTNDPAVANTGMTLGTPFYMAPEQVNGAPATPLVDVYAWGMMLFELLTGARPIDGENMEQVFQHILNTPLDESVMVKAQIPAEIRALVMQATDKNPAARPQDFGAIRGVLQEFLTDAAGAPPSADQPPSVEPPPRPVRQPESAARPLLRLSMLVYGAVILALLATLGTWFWVVRPSLTGKAAAPSAVASYAKAMAEGMIDIPAGTFLAGPDKRPVMLKEFLIDSTEVTAGDFCDLMPCDKPPADRDLPIVNVTIAQARLFAMREGKRLPTPLEWERAARGPNGDLFPWGDADDPTLANVANNPSFGGQGLVHVKSFQAYKDGRANPDGAYQMVGNAWEFVEGRVMPSAEAVARFAALGVLKPAPDANEPWVSVRGGAFTQALAANIVYGSLVVPERYSARDIGFRCVRDPHRD